jgi:hypothetical protein
LGNETLVYSVQIPAGKNEQPAGFLLTAGLSDSRTWQVSYRLAKKWRNIFWLPFHKNLEFTDAQVLQIHHHRTLSGGPVSLFWEDRVRWVKEGKTLEGHGLSTYLYTPRLSNPFFFPMLKAKTIRLVKPAPGPPDSRDRPGGGIFFNRPDPT